MPQLDDIDLELAEMILEHKRFRPSDMYKAGRSETIDGTPIPRERNGQLQFHSAPHIIRLIAPGNGFGKTAASAVEADWYAQGDHPYQPADMKRLQGRKRQIVWTATKYQQFMMMKPKIEMWFTPGFQWIGSPWWCYRWDGKADLFIITGETDWRTLQGIEPDLVIFDETPPAALWYEFQKRRRGATETRYVMSATQTQGLTWMYSDVYKPWKDFHEKLGLSEDEAMLRQLHQFSEPGLAGVPGIWCWPKGSHLDNPTATAATWAWYLVNTAGSPAERAVRLYGGFRQFAQSPVFDPEALERLRAFLQVGLRGAILPTKETK